MLLDLVERITLYRLLLHIDIELADAQRSRGCPHCGGRLDRAYYQRKPKGGPDVLPDECLVRRSLCCGVEGCRRRTLPASSLFWGRRVYWAGVILVAVTLRQSCSSGYSANKLCQHLGIPRSTLARWLAYFRDEFARSPQWLRLRGRAHPEIRNDLLPCDLVLRFLQAHEKSEAGLVACLAFLASGWSAGGGRGS